MKYVYGSCVVAIMLFFLGTLKEYPGNWGVYILFSISAGLLLINGLIKSALYFDTFIGIFLWLGFWLKFSIRLAFMDGLFHEPVGAFDGSGGAFDRALVVSSVAFIGLLSASVIRRLYFRYPVVHQEINSKGLFVFYEQYRKRILVGFFFLVALVSVSNAYLGIYQRGMVSRMDLPQGVSGVFKWLLQFGLASIVSLIVRFEIKLNGGMSWTAFITAIFEGFFSNVSLLSRGMILNGVALILGAWDTVKGMRLVLRRWDWIFYIFLFLITFGVSVISVNYVRVASIRDSISHLDKMKTLPVKVDGGDVNISSTFSSAVPLFIDRWVGIEGVMAVTSFNNLGWDMWREAWSERFNEGELSLYDRVFIKTPYAADHIDKSKYHFVSLPGVIAFFYYPGSVVFLFGSMVVIGLVAAFFEVICYRFSGGNLILTSLFSQVIAFRYSSFGYVPIQSYLLFGSLVINVLLILGAEYLSVKYTRWTSREMLGRERG